MLREVISHEWFTIIIIVCLCILATVKYIFPQRFTDFLLTPGNSKYLKVYERDQKFIDLFDGLLYANFTLTVGLFGFLFYNYQIEALDFNIFTYLKITFGIACLFLMKILLERLAASLFEIDSLIDSYLFQKTSYKNYLGVILIPINLLLIFTFTPNTTLFFVIIALLFSLNIIGFLSSFRAHQKLIISHLFYFILYLCAFEIAPYVILYKVFMRS